MVFSNSRRSEEKNVVLIFPIMDLLFRRVIIKLGNFRIDLLKRKQRNLMSAEPSTYAMDTQIQQLLPSSGSASTSDDVCSPFSENSKVHWPSDVPSLINSSLHVNEVTKPSNFMMGVRIRSEN